MLMLNVIYAECRNLAHYAEFHYGVCHYSVRHYAECHYVSVATPNKKLYKDCYAII